MKLLRGGPITSKPEPPTISELLAGHRHDGRMLPRHRCNMYRHRRKLPWLHGAYRGPGQRIGHELEARGVVLTHDLMVTLSWFHGTHPSHCWRDRERLVDHLVRHAELNGWKLNRVTLASVALKSMRDEARAQGVDHKIVHDPNPKWTARRQRAKARLAARKASSPKKRPRRIA